MFLFCTIYWYSYRVVHSGECEHHYWLVRGCWLHGNDWVNKDYTRMHSSRMRTARSSSCQRVCLSACWNTPPPGVGLEIPPGVVLETPLARPLNLPPGCDPGQTTQLPPGCGPGNSPPPPPARPLKLAPGCGPGKMQGMLGYTPNPLLDTCKACWDTTCRACWDATPSCGQTDMCKNITFANFVCGRKNG